MAHQQILLQCQCIFAGGPNGVRYNGVPYSTVMALLLHGLLTSIFLIILYVRTPARYYQINMMKTEESLLILVVQAALSHPLFLPLIY